MDSTLYAFAKYFCWMDLLSERLTFGFFDSLEAREEFFQAMWTPRGPLTWYPYRPPVPCSGDDAQVFAVQQRGIGEAMRVGQNGDIRCLSYAEFLIRQHEPDLAAQLAPLRVFLERLTPDTCRGRRLMQMSEFLEASKTHWEQELRECMPSHRSGRSSLAQSTCCFRR
jgi:hypothetical protein